MSVEKTEKVKQVGIWIRVSTEDQAKGESPEHHEKRARFTDTTVTRLLRDPVAKGSKRNNHTNGTDGNGRRSHKSEAEWVYTQVEPIVSEDLWDQCNRILDSQEKKRTRPARKAVHLFAGVTYCGCGAKMYVPSNMPKYRCIKCRNKIGTDDLEEVFHQQLKAFFFSPDEIANYLKQADHVIEEKDGLLHALTEEEGKIRQEMDFLKIQYLSSDQILHEARDLYSRWPNLSTEEKRAIVEHITEQISITDNEVTITLAYLPSSSELTATEQHLPPVTWTRV